VQSSRLLVLLAAFSLAAVPAASASAPERSLAETIERFETLRLDDASSPVSDLRLTSGHLTLLCKSGSAARVKAGDTVVGIFFQGTGALEYRSEDAIEFPTVLFNVKKASSLSAEKSDKAVVIRDGFERVLFLSAGRPLPELPAGSPASLQPAFAKVRDIYRRAQISPFSHFFAHQAIDAPDSAAVVAFVDGGKDRLAYTWDSFDGRFETLLQLDTNSASGERGKLLYPTVLSEQPIGRDRRDPVVPLYFLTDVDLTLSASAGKDASLSVVETVVPQGQKQRVFLFALHNTLYVPIGANGWESRSYHVRKVTDESGSALAHDHRFGQIAVETPAPVEAGASAKIRFEIEGDFLIRPGGDNFWELGLGGGDWFPQPDLNGQFFTWHAVVRVRKPFMPFASGVTVSRRTEGDDNILETKTDKPVSTPAIAAGKYELREETRNGLTIRVATYAMRNERAGKQLTDLAFGIIDYYQNFLGPFPFPEFNIIEINTWGFGQAPPNILFITKEAFNPLMGEENQLFSQGVNERFAHEIAHQYWGHVVKMPSFEEQWLEESFAEYSAALFLKALKGQSAYDSLLHHWKTQASQASDSSAIPLANRLRVPSDFYRQFLLRTGLIYDKGSYLLATLHRELGDQTFLTFLKSYQKTFRWKFGSTKTVAGLLQALTKKDYMPFFEANYWGTGMPK